MVTRGLLSVHTLAKHQFLMHCIYPNYFFLTADEKSKWGWLLKNYKNGVKEKKKSHLIWLAGEYSTVQMLLVDDTQLYEGVKHCPFYWFLYTHKLTQQTMWTGHFIRRWHLFNCALIQIFSQPITRQQFSAFTLLNACWTSNQMNYSSRGPH